MTFARRTFLALAALAGLAPRVAQAQDIPTRPVKIVVNLAVGGPADLMARVFSEYLQGRIGQPVVVEALPGAGGLIGARAVARAEPDGHTILFTLENVVTITPLIQDNLLIDPRTDLVPFSFVGTFEQALAVNPAKGVRTVQELVTKARTQPVPVSYGSAGVGSPGHLAFLAFAQRAGISGTHIPFSGGAPAVIALLGGHVDVGFVVIGGVRQHIDAGRLVALATSGKERSPALPRTPTLAESGFPCFEIAYAYFGMLPKGTPQPVQAWWQERFREMLADPKVVERLKAFDTRVTNGDGASARAWIEQSSARWKAALAGQKLE